MGEAKRNRARTAAAPCRCGSENAAGSCCFDGKNWHKVPAVLGLRSLSPGSVVDRCYMKELGSCRGALSGEHLISRSIIMLLRDDGDFTVSGLPWLAEGEIKPLAPNNLTAKCLCVRHNSALSPLDSAALKFFAALKSCLEDGEEPRHYLISGHDIERWLLKTLKSMAVSGNLARGRERLHGAFQADVRLIEMLDDPQSWPVSTGLYCVMNPGDRFLNHNRFQLAPLAGVANDEIGGLWTNVLGLSFVMMIEPLDLDKNPQLRLAQFRPGRIAVNVRGTTSFIDINWEDAKRHNTVTLNFLTKVQD